MRHYELIATTTFGVEAVCKRELQALGFNVIKTENGKVTFSSDAAGIAKANLWVRTADRILIKMAEFDAYDFDQLFDQTFDLPWSDIIDVDGKFTVNGKSVKSQLSSVPACQKIVKKAVSKSLEKKYNVSWFPETGAEFTILVSLLKDIVTLTIDTSGIALHKRGYRIESVDAPLKETLAATLVMLSYWNKDRTLHDVFCGSGTIPIEAAMIGKNIAPGLNREFASSEWKCIGSDVWKEERKKAFQAIKQDIELDIYASDISTKNLEAAKINAEEAGVDDCITFTRSDFKDIDYSKDYGIIISNPPYGERLQELPEVKKLYRTMGRKFKNLDTWSKYILTSFDGFENLFEKKADRLRKLYNGRLEVKYYQYYGTRPPRN